MSTQRIHELSTTGIETRATLESDGAMVIERVQDCVPIAEITKAMHNEGMHGASDMRLAAVIPNIFIENYCTRFGITYEEFAANHEHKKRLMTDPALKHFRVWGGKIG